MKFIHIGDLQIGPTRRAQKQRALDSILKTLDDLHVKSERADVALVCGDLFDEGHRGIPASPTDRAVVRGFVRDLTHYATRIIIVRGNHDALDPESGDCDLDYLSDPREEIYVFSRPDSLLIDGIGSVYVMPYPSKTVIAEGGDGTVRGSAALDVLLKTWAPLSRGPYDLPVVYVGHHNVAGSTTESGQPLIGREVEVSADRLMDLHADYYALGHIHRPQPLPGQDALPHAPLGARGGYAGSIAPCDFGEAAPKGFAIVEIGIDGESVIEWHHIENDRLLTVEGTFTCAEGVSVFVWKHDGRQLDRTEVKLRYTVSDRDTAKALAARGDQEMMFRALGATRIVWEPRVQRATAERSGAAEVARALTVAEKVSATWRAQGDKAPPLDMQTRALAKLDEIGGAP